MAPQFTPAEVEYMQQQAAAGHKPPDVLRRMAQRRARRGLAPPDATSVRRVLKGKTHARAKTETRGRKPSLSPAVVQKMNRVRKGLVKKANNQREVRWCDVIRSSRAPKVHRGTALRSFHREGLDVQRRRPREKPDRTKAHAAERVEMCQALKHKPATYFTNCVDMIIDNKKFDVPTTERARAYMNKTRVRGHLRTPGEGTLPEFTRPGRKKNRMYTGVSASACAGISNGRIVLWHYLPTRWNGQVVADLYAGPIADALRKARGDKRQYLVLEDNDPTGYKSGKAVAAKERLHIKAMMFPRYSPDLNPLDYSLWHEIERRMVQRKPAKVETVEAYKKRLRLVALRLPRRVVLKAVGALPRRIKAVIEAKGNSIPRD